MVLIQVSGTSPLQYGGRYVAIMFYYTGFTNGISYSRAAGKNLRSAVTAQPTGSVCPASSLGFASIFIQITLSGTDVCEVTVSPLHEVFDGSNEAFLCKALHL